jgi:hypothetical protein
VALGTVADPLAFAQVSEALLVLEEYGPMQRAAAISSVAFAARWGIRPIEAAAGGSQAATSRKMTLVELPPS